MEIRQKGFKEYMADDPSLAEKYTYEEFYGQKNATPDNEDVAIEQVFNACMEMCSTLEKVE